ASRLVVPYRTWSWLAGPGVPGSNGNIGAVRSSAWICDFSSTASTIAPSGGARYSPTMSRTLSMNSGSVDSFQLSTRCGLSPNARQIRARDANACAVFARRTDPCSVCRSGPVNPSNASFGPRPSPTNRAYQINNVPTTQDTSLIFNV